MEVDAVSHGLFFAAQQAASAKAAKTKKQEKTRKSAFASALERSQAEYLLEQEGLPPEIAGMEPEEAVVYLKDAADIAADKLKKSQMPDVFADYRQKVSQFMRYIVKTNYQIKTVDRHWVTLTNADGTPRRDTDGRIIKRHKDTTHQIMLVNQKLDEMARWLLSSHKDTLQMLARLDEINGMLVDLMAT